MSSVGKIVRTVVEPDGWRRVHIIARHDGHFGYAEERFYSYDPDNDPEAGHWVQVSSSSSVCDSPETAWREARAAIHWLRAISN